MATWHDVRAVHQSDPSADIYVTSPAAVCDQIMLSFETDPVDYLPCMYKKLFKVYETPSTFFTAVLPQIGLFWWI